MSKAILANNKSVSIGKYVGTGTLNFNFNNERANLVTATSDEYLLCNYLYLFRSPTTGSGVAGEVIVYEPTLNISMLQLSPASGLNTAPYEFVALNELYTGTGKKLIVPPGASITVGALIAGGGAGTYFISYKYSFTRFVNSPS
jgi:hypothetical protein